MSSINFSNPDCIRSTVTDGVTIGRPTCSVHDCQNRLSSTKDAFCHVHTEQSKLCAVIECGLQAELGFRTCAQEDHRGLETYRELQGKAMFQLRKRLERARPSDSKAAQENDEDVLIDEDGICSDKPEGGNRKSKARFGRRWTHNEELCVGSCGVILGRSTFVGSEAPNGVRVCKF